MTTASAQTPTTVFTQPFDWTLKKLTILPATNHGLFKVNETITLATLNNISVNVYDLYGRTVYAGVPTTRTFAAGHYFVECNGDRSQFAVLPTDYAGVSYLGDQAFLGYIAGSERQRLIQPTWFRTGAARWPLVQPTRGTWNWAQMDSTVTNNPNRKLMIIAGGGSPPAWVTPTDMASNYAVFTTALVQRYRGKVGAVEIWNEPDSGNFVNDTNWIKNLADVHVAGSAAIKAVDASVLVLGTSASSAGSVGLTAGLSQYGFGTSMSGLSWHDYWAFKFPPDKPVSFDNSVTPDIFGRGQAHREAAAFNGPLFITELGLYGRSALGIPTPTIETGYTGGIVTNAPDWAVGMARGVKYAVMYRAAGAEMMMAHLLSHEDASLTDQQNALYGWEYGQRGPKPKTTAFLMAGYWLNDATAQGYRTPGNQLVLSAWRRPNNTSVVFAWAGEGQSFALTNSTVLTMTDLYGNALQVTRLGEQPILFHSSNPDAASLLQAVLAKLPALNQPPVPVFLPNYTVLKNRPLVFTLKANDPDQDPVTFSAAALPAGAVLNSTNGAFAWTPTTNQLGQYSITFTVTDARGLSAPVSTLISVIGSSDDGLLGWWKLDETAGTVVADSVGASPGNLVTNGVGSTWVAGRVGNAVTLDGINRYININNASLAVTNNFTITAWINPRLALPDQGVFFCLRSRYAESGIKLAVNRRNDLFFEGQTATGWKQIYYALGGIQTNLWQHLVVVYDKSVFAVYLNGQRLSPAYGDSGSWGGDIVMNPIGVTRIGAEGGGVPTYFFDGRIDDVRVYGRTLTPAEVTALYQWNGAARLSAPANLRATGR